MKRMNPIHLFSLSGVSLCTWLISIFTMVPVASAQSVEESLELPLHLTSFTHHIGISVNDVLKSAEFYSRVFGGENVFGEQEPALRYFISFKSGDPSVDAGDVAIGKVGTAGSVGRTEPLIDHVAVAGVHHYGSAWRKALAEIDVNALPQAGIIFDNDNIPVQVAGALDESMAAGEITSMPSLYSGEPLVKSIGFDHILLRVSDLDASAAFYKQVFGIEPESRNVDTLWYFDGNTRMGMRLTKAGEEPGVETYGVKIERFNRASLSTALTGIGATVHPAESGDTDQLLRISDVDGINLVLTAE